MSTIFSYFYRILKAMGSHWRDLYVTERLRWLWPILCGKWMWGSWGWESSKEASAEIQESSNGWRPGPIWQQWGIKDRTWGEAPDFADVEWRTGWTQDDTWVSVCSDQVAERLAIRVAKTGRTFCAGRMMRSVWHIWSLRELWFF